MYDARLLPTAYGIGGDLPDLRPMVVIIAWDLVFATLVTLGLIPLLYSLVTIPPRLRKNKIVTQRVTPGSEFHPVS